MNQHVIAELSSELIMRYYENEPMPFLEHMDDEALWYGPSKGQFLRGREAMIRAWSAEEHPLTFTVGDMKAEPISTNMAFCNVMLTCTVVTHYPDGHDLSVDQRLLLCWGERTSTDEQGKKHREPRILVCHISNPHDKHEDDFIYPGHFDQVCTGRSVMPQKGRRLHFHGVDRADYFIMSDTIRWIDASGGGKHAILHCAMGPVEVLATIRELARKYPDLFLRCHASHLVNPNYIRSIRRFKVTMTNGVELPIPEKKYTAFRDQALRRLKEIPSEHEA